MTSPSRSQVKHEVYYLGRVQGVGFRYTTANIARRYDVTGYVQNLDDGRVKLVVEGAADQVRQMLEDVAAAMQGNITHTTQDSSEPSRQFSEFEIRT